MKLDAIIWTGVLAFYGVIGVTYLLVGGEPAGVSLLLAGAALGGLIAGWAWDYTRRHDQRVEDRPGSDAGDSAGVVGVYPTASLRPLALAVGSTATVLGVPLGSWMSMIGLAIVGSQVLLLVRDADS